MHRKIIMALVAVAATFVMTVPAGAATSPVVFNSVPDQLPPNVPSYGAEAYSFVRLGDAVRFAPGKRVLKNVKVVMSDWACETGTWDSGCVTTPGSSFALPVTFNIYALGAGGTVGSLLATKTQTFTFKFRPSSDPTNCPSNTTAWYSTVTGKCYNGRAQKITFRFLTQHVKLRNQVVYGIEYNTRDFGPNPTGVSGPADSLNIGAAAGLPTRGQDLNPNGFYIEGPLGGTVADSPCTASTPATPNVFSLDDGCQTGYNPLVRFLVKK